MGNREFLAKWSIEVQNLFSSPENLLQLLHCLFIRDQYGIFYLFQKDKIVLN